MGHSVYYVYHYVPWVINILLTFTISTIKIFYKVD